MMADLGILWLFPGNGRYSPNSSSKSIAISVQCLFERHIGWCQQPLAEDPPNVFAPKTQKIRGIPINENARKVLKYWALGKRNEFVFYNPETGKPFVDLKAGFALACSNAKIEGVTWHTLRHTFASRLVDRGVDIVTVKELWGHSSLTVTMRYTHAYLDSKRAAVEKLPHNECDKGVTVCTKMQQSRLRLSQNAV